MKAVALLRSIPSPVSAQQGKYMHIEKGHQWRNSRKHIAIASGVQAAVVRLIGHKAPPSASPDFISRNFDIGIRRFSIEMVESHHTYIGKLCRNSVKIAVHPPLWAKKPLKTVMIIAASTGEGYCSG